MEETTESRPLSAEEKYFYKQSYKDPVESIARIEDVAKFLAGATATTSGLFLSAFKLVLGTAPAQGPFWLLPFVFWAISIIVLVLVLFPQRYLVGQSQPASWKEGFLRVRRNKYTLLAVGTLFFVVGILLAILPLAV